MDASTMSQVGMGGGVISILTIAFQVFKYINHRNVRSHCCGKTVEMGIDVDTPAEVPVAVAPAPVPPPAGEPPRRVSLVIRSPEPIEPGIVAVLPRPNFPISTS
jgi:hypothetical protein